jgi:hypothetical protein
MEFKSGTIEKELFVKQFSVCISAGRSYKNIILEHPDERSSYYTAQFIGQDSFLVGGSNKNVFKVKDQKISTDLGVVSEITNGVVCSDKV